MIVVDVNVLAFYVIEGERTREAHALRRKDAGWLVPAFWAVEFQSILWKYVRHGGMPLEAGLDFLEKATAMFSRNEVVPAPDIVLRDALNWGITVYDAQYASLARQYGVPCVTEDGAVQRACPDIAVSLSKFISSPGGSIVRESAEGYRVSSRRKSRTPSRVAIRRSKP